MTRLSALLSCGSERARRTKVLDPFQLVVDRSRIRGDDRIILRHRQLVVIEVAGERFDVAGAVGRGRTLAHAPQPLRHPLQALGQRRGGGRHDAMKADQQQLPGTALKCVEARRQEVIRHVVVEQLLLAAHRVLVEFGAAADKGLVQELLRLVAQRPLHHFGQPPAEFRRLLGNEPPAVLPGTEQRLEGRQRAHQRAGTLHVLQQTP